MPEYKNKVVKELLRRSDINSDIQVVANTYMNISDDILFKKQPDFVIIFAWHYAIPIAKDLRKKGLKSKFIIPLPSSQQIILTPFL